MIPMSDKAKTILIDAVVQANKKDVPDFRIENELTTFVSKHFLKWDFINKNVTHSLSGEYQIIRIERGSLWEFVLLFDKNTGCAYAMMNEKRFHQLCDRDERDKVHYIDALASINTDMESKKAKQLYLFEVDNSHWEETVNSVLKKMIYSLHGEVKRFVVVTFKVEQKEIKSVTAYVPAADLSIAYEENWNDFIAPDFSVVFAQEEVEQPEEEIVLGLRKEISIHEKDQIVHLRQDNAEKNR